MEALSNCYPGYREVHWPFDSAASARLVATELELGLQLHFEGLDNLAVEPAEAVVACAVELAESAPEVRQVLGPAEE